MSSDIQDQGHYTCKCGKAFNTQEELDNHKKSDQSGEHLI